MITVFSFRISGIRTIETLMCFERQGFFKIVMLRHLGACKTRRVVLESVLTVNSTIAID